MSPHSKTCVSSALSIEEKIVASGIRGFENKAIKVLDPAEASKPIRVVFEYRDEFKSSVKSINSDEDFQNHKKEMREHFMKENSARLQTIALEGFSKIIVSPYAPYIVLEYESLAAFISQNFLKLTLCDRQDLVRVYIESKKKTDAAIRNQSDGPAYSFHEALTDIGIPRNTLFDGTGIKIGSFENHIPPIDHPNFAGITIHRRGSSTSSHAASVASVFGGRAGIARGAELYFASDDALCFEDACTWFIDNDVHLVNQSCCYDGQFDYDSDSAYLDYVANQYKITFVNAAGNNNQVQSPSTGVNSLCVVSCDANNDVSAFSASGFGPSIQGKLYKPTFSAPGENIVGIPNISEPLDGMSFSAPMITGIAALLMQEFPTLKFYPAAVFFRLGFFRVHGKRTNDSLGFRRWLWPNSLPNGSGGCK